MALLNRLDQYDDLVGDVAAFRSACARPLPDTCWVPNEHRDALAALPPRGLEPLSWTNHGFRITEKDLAFGIHFLLGGLLIQEEAAMMAVGALGLQPGERVLDLCAAPGNKTVQLAAAVGLSGSVVGNDVSAARLQVLRGIVDRFRLAQVHLTVHDGTSFPDRRFDATNEPVRFDAVLADVPCSCEGTCRKNPSVLDLRSLHRTACLPRLQETLLRRAILMTRPGGRVLYATCTFAPEENEMVVDRVLSQPGREGTVSVERIDIPGLQLDPGIDRWNGRALHPSLTHTRRVWPHRNDTGGFYLALLRKDGSPVRSDWPPRTDSGTVDPQALPWSAYALDEPFYRNYRHITTGKRGGRLVHVRSTDVPFNTVSVGMSGLNQKARDPRPSSSLAPLLAHHACAGTAEVPKDAILAFLKRETVVPSELVPPRDRTRYVLVRSGPIRLGLGHVDNAGRVASLFPSHLAGLPVSDWLDRLGG